MQEVSQVLAQSYPQANKSLSNSDSDGVSASVAQGKSKNTNTKTLKEVRRIAYTLVERLNNPDRYQLYCKYAWKLTEATIWRNLEQVEEAKQKGKTATPAALFTWLCEQELEA